MGAGERRACAWSAQSGSAPLLARLLRRFGFRSCLAMAHPVFGPRFREKEDKRGKRVRWWDSATWELVGLRRGTLWGQLRLGTGLRRTGGGVGLEG